MTPKMRKVAIMAAKKSGRMLLREFEGFNRQTIKLKSHHEILTNCDLMSEKIIINEIKKEFSGHAILSEEAGDNKKKSDYLWIIDPIDGTTNFSMHNPLFSVSIGLAHKGKIVFGVIYAPFLKEMYIAEAGKGAFLRKEKGSKAIKKKIKVSTIKSGKVLNAFCHGNRVKDVKKAIKYYGKQKLGGFDCRQMGSAAIELAFVACGRIESIVIPGAHAWDVAAGILLVREAGGKVTDFKGKKWSLKSADMAASNGKVHKDLIKTLKA